MKRYNLLYGVLSLLIISVSCERTNDLEGYTASNKESLGLIASVNSLLFKAGDDDTISSQIVKIVSNTSWEITNIPEEWLEVDKTSGDGDCDVTFSAKENTTHAPRNSKLHIIYDTKEEGRKDKEIIVAQKEDRYIDIKLKNKVLPFKFYETKINCAVESNVHWRVKFEDDASWCWTDTTEGYGSQDFVVHCDSNETRDSRSVKLSIYFGDSPTSTRIKDFIEIIQDPDYFLKAEDDYEKPKPPIEFEYRGGTEHFKINSNVDWQITLNSEWINDISAHEIGNSNSDAFKKTVDGETHIIRGKGNAIIYISATSLEYAPQGTSRSDATIIIDCTDTSKGVRCPPITVSQKPY